MLSNGVYSVAFSSGQGQLGTGGVAYLIDGKVYGGDAHFYYKGAVGASGETVTGNIHVGAHQRPSPSIFGPLTDFDLDLSGNASSDLFNFSGTVVGRPGMTITVKGRRIADV